MLRCFFNKDTNTLSVVLENPTPDTLERVKTFLGAEIENVTGIISNGESIPQPQIPTVSSQEPTTPSQKEIPIGEFDVADIPPEQETVPAETDGINLGLLGGQPSKVPAENETPAPAEEEPAPAVKEDAAEEKPQENADFEPYAFDFGMNQGKRIIDFVNAENAKTAYNYLWFILDKNFKKVQEKKQQIIQNINVATQNLLESGFIPNEEETIEMGKVFLLCLPEEKVNKLIALEGYASVEEAIKANNTEWFSQIVDVYTQR